MKDADADVVTDDDAEAAAATAAAEVDATPVIQWPVTINFKTPIEFGKKTIESITLRRGRAGDMVGIKLTTGAVPFDDVLALASKLSGQPLPMIKMIDFEDMPEVTEAVLDFFARYLASGRPR